MGVAVMTSTCGDSPLRKRRARCATPKRCCSSTTTRPSRRNSTGDSASACVPTSTSIRPAASSSSSRRRAGPRTRPVSSAMRTPAAVSQEARLVACCSARISVGAISAPWTPVRGRQHQREARHDRLARSDVALEQARHRAPGREVGRDLPHRALLRPRERERNGRAGARARRLGRLDDEALALPQALALGLDARGQHEQLLARELAPPGLSRLEARREVDVFERPRELRRRGGGRREDGIEPVQGPAHEGAPLALRDLAGAVVDAHDPAGVHRIRLLGGAEELGLRILDPHLSARRGHGRSEERGVRALERLHEGRVPVVPDDPHRARSVVGGGLDAQQAAPHPHRLDAVEAHEDGRGLAPLERRDRREVAAILVAERQREQEVADRAETLGGQPLAARRPDAGNPGNRVAEVNSVRGGAGRRRQVASGAWKVMDTRPNLSTSPLCSAIGTPVVRRLPLT